jgi:hypothetical protein
MFLQDTWKLTRNMTVNYGLRWEAQHFPDPVIPPSQTAYGPNLSDPKFPSTGLLPNQNEMFQPRLGFAWDIKGNGKSAIAAGTFFNTAIRVAAPPGPTYALIISVRLSVLTLFHRLGDDDIPSNTNF